MAEEHGKAQSGEKLCNLDHLLANLGFNQAAIERLINLFLHNTPALKKRLLEASRSENRSALRNALHDIRSSCVLFSGSECVRQARELEFVVCDDARYASFDKTALDSMAISLADCISSMASELTAYIDQHKQLPPEKS